MTWNGCAQGRDHAALGLSHCPAQLCSVLCGGFQLAAPSPSQRTLGESWILTHFRQDCLGPLEELETRGLAQLQKTPRVYILAWLTASLTGLLPGFMTSKLSHC